MKVEDKREKIRLINLPRGEVFESENKVYIKTKEREDGLITCVVLKNGELSYLSDEFEVTPINAKVVIE